MKTSDVLNKLEEYAPLEISRAFVAAGAYDNSGLLIDTGEPVKKAAFTLELSAAAVAFAEEEGCNLIVTHHPAIYRPVASLCAGDPTTGPLVKAIRAGISVISMHLNLDAAPGGIDESLARALGAEETKILRPILGDAGYGRAFSVGPIRFSAYLENVRKTFGDRVIAYGEDRPVSRVASFCGGGAGDALEYGAAADVIVTSDMPYHVIKELVERGKNLILIPHYTAEERGFFLFFNRIAPTLGVPSSYFKDGRF